MYENNEYVRIYSKGRKEGERAVLRMVDMILKGCPSWDKEEYFRCSLDTLLEVFNYGEEKDKKNKE